MQAPRVILTVETANVRRFCIAEYDALDARLSELMGLEALSEERKSTSTSP